MKRIACEMCGSSDVIKQDGLYICQNCGTKYSVEEARNLMIEGVVDVSGSTVKIDSTDELMNLFMLARRARDESDLDNQWMYYEMILRRDPNNWEAYFYYRISKIFANTNYLSSRSAKEAAHTVLGLIWDSVKSDEEATAAVSIVAGYYESRCVGRFNSIGHNFSFEYPRAGSLKIKNMYQESYYHSVKEIEDVLLCLGDAIKLGFENIIAVRPVIAHVWKTVFEIEACALPNFRRADRKQEDSRRLSQYAARIKQYDPLYQVPKARKADWERW